MGIGIGQPWLTKLYVVIGGVEEADWAKEAGWPSPGNSVYHCELQDDGTWLCDREDNGCRVWFSDGYWNVAGWINTVRPGETFFVGARSEAPLWSMANDDPPSGLYYGGFASISAAYSLPSSQPDSMTSVAELIGLPVSMTTFAKPLTVDATHMVLCYGDKRDAMSIRVLVDKGYTPP